MTGIRYESVRSAPKAGGCVHFLPESLSALQKIREHLEASVVTESRTHVRIGGRKRCSCEARLLKHRRDGALLGSDPQHVTPQRERIPRSKYGRHRIVRRRSGCNCILENKAFSSETIQKWRGGTAVPEKSDVVGTETVHRDQNKGTWRHYMDPVCAMLRLNARWFTETLTLAEPP